MLKGQQHKIFTPTIFRNLTLLTPPIYLMKHFENGFVFVDMFVVNVRKSDSVVLVISRVKITGLWRPFNTVWNAYDNIVYLHSFYVIIPLMTLTK